MPALPKALLGRFSVSKPFLWFFPPHISPLLRQAWPLAPQGTGRVCVFCLAPDWRAGKAVAALKGSAILCAAFAAAGSNPCTNTLFPFAKVPPPHSSMALLRGRAGPMRGEPETGDPLKPAPCIKQATCRAAAGWRGSYTATLPARQSERGALFCPGGLFFKRKSKIQMDPRGKWRGKEAATSEVQQVGGGAPLPQAPGVPAWPMSGVFPP